MKPEIRPSGADTWMLCIGQPAFVESLNLPDGSSFYADEGSVAHELGAQALIDGQDTIAEELGNVIRYGDSSVEVTQEMVTAVDIYLELVYQASYGHELLVEQTIDCGGVLGRGRSGTGDAIIIPQGDNPEDLPLEIHDFKYGAGIEVFSEKNRQEMIYGASYIISHSLEEQFSQVKLVIHQPRIKSAPDEWLVDVDKLLKWAELAKKKAKEAHFAKAGEKLNPGEVQCFWCPAKAQCPKLQANVEHVFDDIDELSDSVILPADHAAIAKKRQMVPLVEMWAKAVKMESHAILERGEELPGWKLVVGRKGNRQFTSEKKAVARIQRFRIRKDQMYDMKLKTPTQMKTILTSTQFERLEEEGLIRQDDGNPSVAPDTDPRPTLERGPMFDDLTD